MAIPSLFQLIDASKLTGNIDKTRNETALNFTKQSELANEIWIGPADSAPKSNQPFYEDFKDYLDLETFTYGPFRLPAFIKDLFPDGFFQAKTRKKDFLNESENVINISTVLDDRMFVVSWYGNDYIIKGFQGTKWN